MNKNEILKAALACQGWGTEGQLSVMYDLVQKHAQVDGDILEIGSAWGRSAVMFGLSSPKKLWSIDPHSGGLRYILNNENQNSYDEFLGNLKKNGLIDKVGVVKATTKDARDQQLIPADVKFAFVYIDGLHTAEGVEIDIDFAWPRLTPGAVVAFDDYFVPGVVDMKEMIDAKVKAYGQKLILDDKVKLAYFIYTKD